MKEKPIFEEVFAQLVSQPKLLLKVLLGSALSFVPILNFFAFGYLYRYSAQLRRSGQIELPEWTDWAGIPAKGSSRSKNLGLLASALAISVLLLSPPDKSLPLVF